MERERGTKRERSTGSIHVVPLLELCGNKGCKNNIEGLTKA